MDAVRRRIPRRLVAAFLAVAVLGLAALVFAVALTGTARVVALVAVGVLLAGLGLWKLPQWQAEAARHQGSGRSAFELENEARRTLAEVIGGLFLVIGLAVTWQQLASTREEQRMAREELQAASTSAAGDRELAQQQQISERLARAVDQLADERLQVRLGGISALERIALDSPVDALPVMEILTAFVRAQAPWTPPSPGATPVPSRAPPADDVQAVLTVLGRSDWENGWWPYPAPSEPRGISRRGSAMPSEPCLDLTGTDLRNALLAQGNFPPLCLGAANLSEADLTDANLTHANLSGAYLGEADLTGANLAQANLSLTNLTGAFLTETDLTSANLGGAQLSDAHLGEADLTGAFLFLTNLTGADLVEANLTGANLIGANLTGAALVGANLTGATLIGVDLTGVSSLKEADLSDADLSDANLSGAYLDEADLTGANLSEADLSKADLTGANLSTAQNLTQSQIDSAITDESTQLPPDLSNPANESPSPYARRHA